LSEHERLRFDVFREITCEP